MEMLFLRTVKAQKQLLKETQSGMWKLNFQRVNYWEWIFQKNLFLKLI